ncbi:MAG: hypothetical protein F4135_00535 [Acidimicrobiia bacterium]|nr:hypothetical protein [Acidimicrobiia bacterium]
MLTTAPPRKIFGPITWIMIGLTLLFLAGTYLHPASAQEEDPQETPAVEAEVPVPAISIPDEAPAEPEAEWSYRFLVPATLVLGTLAVVGAVIMYFVRVTKNRYRVIR